VRIDLLLLVHHDKLLIPCSIVGLYVTLIVFGSRFLRSSIFNLETTSIIVEELPNVDRIINLCKDIYLVRESKEFSLEEDLVSKLLFLYRSPETLIKWTRASEE
jgi:piezo-type mechanosensitive ion channel component 1/2